MAKFKVDGRLYEFLSAEQYAQLVNKADRDELINYVQTFASNANFPTTGERGIIYVDESTNEVFIWDGVKYDSINYDSISKTKVDAIPENPKYTDTRYTAGTNITIDEDNQISATDTTYTAGTNVSIDATGKISATDTTYTAGTNVSIDEDNQISAADTTYTAGTNVSIDATGKISATDTTYTAGTNVSIDATGKISATDVVTSVAGRTGAVTLTKTDVGLSNVANYFSYANVFLNESAYQALAVKDANTLYLRPKE